MTTSSGDASDRNCCRSSNTGTCRHAHDAVATTGGEMLTKLSSSLTLCQRSKHHTSNDLAHCKTAIMASVCVAGAVLVCLRQIPVSSCSSNSGTGRTAVADVATSDLALLINCANMCIACKLIGLIPPYLFQPLNRLLCAAPKHPSDLKRCSLLQERCMECSSRQARPDQPNLDC